MKSFRLLAFVACVGLLSSVALPQGGLGKGKGDQGGKSTGGQSTGGQSTGGSSQGGGLGKQTGGGSSSGGRTTGGGNTQGGGSSSGGGLGKSQGGGSSSGGRATGGNTQGGGSSSGGSSQGGLGKGRGNQGGGSTTGGNTQGGGSSSGGGLGRSQGGGSSSGGRTTGSGSSSGGGLGRSQGGGSNGGGGFGDRTDQNRNNGQLGRVGDVPDRTNSIGRVQNGRLGQSNYNSNNSLGRTGDGFRIEQPRLNLNKGSLQIQVQRSETIRTNRNNYDGYNNGWRDGYYSYSNNWRDDYFCYPHYTFNPWGNNCSVSPWYYYGHLPGYISSSRIFWFQNVSCNWGIGTIYSWDRNRGWDNGYNSGYDRRNSELDDAVYDLVNAFERGDSRALGRLIPRHGRVNIYMDSMYTYTLDSDDFYDMMQDNIQSTRTTRYSIDRVRTTRDEAQVSATHEFLDPWGRRQCVYHNYRFEQDRYGYVITDFRSSYRP